MNQNTLRTAVWDAAYAANREQGMAEIVARKLADKVLEKFTQVRATTSKANSVPPEKLAEIRQMLLEGTLSMHNIAAKAGTGVSTVQRVKKDLEHSTGRKVGMAANAA